MAGILSFGSWPSAVGFDRLVDGDDSLFLVWRESVFRFLEGAMVRTVIMAVL